MRRAARLALCLLVLPAAAAAGATREQVRVVGSSTAFPYSQAVAEEFAGETGQPSPVVEATGTGGGLRIFCAGVGPRTPDVTVASRRILPSERALCRRNGVADLTEVRFGEDAVVIAQSRDAVPTDFSRAELFQAIGASVEVDGAIVPNPYRRWRDIDPRLPDAPIEVFGPPLTSGTRDALVALILDQGCRAFPAIAALPEPERAGVCGRIRQDGPFIAAGESDTVTVRRLAADPGAVGIFGYSLLYENADRLRGAALDGVEPTGEAIASGAYGAIRPLYLYVKNAHRGVIPGLDGFLAEYVSEAAIGPDGYLAERGLVPLAAAERAHQRAVMAAGTPLSDD
ncbi:MAG: substrate-binding domain-containing protein [Amaricoccus sp.]|uniref:substrate-binding domain-containing protein n=1 Tax=Amaricoccus sp. TaxID=1872485 RepID=UPI0039E6F7ED